MKPVLEPIEKLEGAALPLFLAWDKARGGRISAVIFDRRATRSQAKNNATLRAQSQGAAGGVVGSLQPIGRDARRRRLAIHPLNLTRDPLQFFNRLLRRARFTPLGISC